MTDEPENLVLVQILEMRADFAKLQRGIDDLTTIARSTLKRVTLLDERFELFDRRIDLLGARFGAMREDLESMMRAEMMVAKAVWQRDLEAAVEAAQATLAALEGAVYNGGDAPKTD